MNLFTILTWFFGAVSVIGVGGCVIFPLTAMPILEKVIAAVVACTVCMWISAIIATGLGSYWYGHHGEYHRGYDAALSAIAAEDDAAIQRATEKRSVWKECRAQNGEWDQSTGECK